MKIEKTEFATTIVINEVSAWIFDLSQIRILQNKGLKLFDDQIHEEEQFQDCLEQLHEEKNLHS